MTTCTRTRTRTRTSGRSPAPAALLMAAVLLALLAASPPAPAAQIYKWVDDAGTEHYSTTPPPNANILTPEPAAGQPPDPAGQSQGNTAPSPPQPVRNSDWDGSVKQVKDYLRHVLHDPDSIKYQDWSPVTAVDTPTHAYMVRCRYRAKNAYGAYVQENQIFYLDAAGAVVNVMDWK